MSTEGLECLSHLWLSLSGVTPNEVSNAVYYAGCQFCQQEWRCSSPGVTVCHGNRSLMSMSLLTRLGGMGKRVKEVI